VRNTPWYRVAVGTDVNIALHTPSARARTRARETKREFPPNGTLWERIWRALAQVFLDDLAAPRSCGRNGGDRARLCRLAEMGLVAQARHADLSRGIRREPGNMRRHHRDIAQREKDGARAERDGLTPSKCLSPRPMEPKTGLPSDCHDRRRRVCCQLPAQMDAGRQRLLYRRRRIGP